MPYKPPPEISKHGIQQLRDNVPCYKQVQIDASLFVMLFEDEIKHYMQRKQEQEQAKEASNEKL